eukprot:g175.t1
MSEDLLSSALDDLDLFDDEDVEEEEEESSEEESEEDTEDEGVNEEEEANPLRRWLTIGEEVAIKRELGDDIDISKIVKDLEYQETTNFLLASSEPLSRWYLQGGNSAQVRRAASCMGDVPSFTKTGLLERAGLTDSEYATRFRQCLQTEIKRRNLADDIKRAYPNMNQLSQSTLSRKNK